MWNWFTYFLTMVMTVMLVVGGNGCGCAYAHAMGEAHDVVSEVKTSEQPMNCGCSHGESSDDEDPQCGCGCDEIAEHKHPLTDPTVAAVAMHNPLDGFKLPALQPRFQALLAVWFADFLDAFVARESEAVVELIDPGPPGVDVPIYLQIQNLRL